MDPKTKIQVDELNALYRDLQGRLSAIQNELFSVGIQLGTLQEKMSEAKVIPKTFNDRVRSEQSGLRPIKLRSMGITGIFPHPVDGASPWNSDSDPAWSE